MAFILVLENIKHAYAGIFSSALEVAFLICRGFFYGFLALFLKANMETAIKIGKVDIKKENENIIIALLFFLALLFISALILSFKSAVLKSFLISVDIFFILEVAGFAEQKLFKINPKGIGD